MRNISDTIARLSALNAKPLNTAGSDSRSHLSPLAHFGSNPGALRAKQFVPQALSHKPPLVVVLHGCTQDAAGYDSGSGWSELAASGGFAVLFPEQQRSNNPNLCFNWYNPQDVTRASGEVRSIYQMIEAMIEAHGIDRNRIFITGLSAGGAMAAAMLATYPELFAGGAIIAGLPYGCAKTIPQAFDRMRGHGFPSDVELRALVRGASSHQGRWPTISIWHGAADRTVAPSNADAILSQWRGVHDVQKAAPQIMGRRTRQAWRDVDGNTLMDVNVIAGMDHGTPIGEQLGSPAPFMLDVDISSTRAIAYAWGITGDQRLLKTSTNPLTPAPDLSETTDQYTRYNAQGKKLPPQEAALPHPPKRGVHGVIEDALRKAGLMK